ncbi:MAG: hypothetical protein ACQEVA_09515 [Myxococcota bacterium]
MDVYDSYSMEMRGRCPLRGTIIANRITFTMERYDTQPEISKKRTNPARKFGRGLVDAASC